MRDSLPLGQGYNGDPLILLIFIAALVVVILAFRALRRAYLRWWDSYGLAGMGGLVLLVLSHQFGWGVPEGMTRRILYGLWG